MVLHRDGSSLAEDGLYVPHRPDLLLSINQVMHCVANDGHLLTVDVLLTEALGQHLWVTFVLADQVLSQCPRDLEFFCELRHGWLVCTPKAADGKQVGCLQLTTSKKATFVFSLITFEPIPQWKLICRGQHACLSPVELHFPFDFFKCLHTTVIHADVGQ